MLVQVEGNDHQQAHPEDTALHGPYAHLLDAQSLHSQNMTNYHSQAYYQHLAAAHYHQGHIQDSQNSNMGPIGTYLHQSYGSAIQVQTINIISGNTSQPPKLV